MFKEISNIFQKKTAFKYVIFALIWTLVVMVLFSVFAPWANKAFGGDGEQTLYTLAVSAFLPGIWLYLGFKAVVYAMRELQGKKTKIVFTVLAGLMALGLIFVAIYQALMVLYAAGFITI